MLQIDGATLRLLLQHGEDLGRVGGVDDDGVLGGVVDDEVGIVVARTLPCKFTQLLSASFFLCL